MGGSITFNPGWREQITAYFEQRFPATRFRFVNAGIPSMGSTPSAFRLRRDILPNTPDLLFVEAAVNDQINKRSTEEQIRAMEGIVRNLRRNSSTIDIVMLHFADPEKIALYRQRREPPVIQNHNAVAAHYQIPTANLAKEVAKRIENREFDWDKDFEDLHPSPFGQKIYAASIIQLLEAAYLNAERKPAHRLPAKLDDFCYDNGRLIEAARIPAQQGWQMVANWKPDDGCETRPNYADAPMLEYSGPGGGTLRFQFSGNAAGIVVAAGPDAGIIEYRIDQTAWQTQNLYTDWSRNCHLPWYYTLAAGLTDNEHNLEIRIRAEKDPRSDGNACRIRYFFVNQI